MRRLAAWILLAGAALLPALQQPALITIDYPREGSIFPPEITPPTFLWRDAAPDTKRWRIDISFADGSAGLHAESRGERLKIGEIDPRTVAPTNELPKLSPQQAASWAWTPDNATWDAIKKHSVRRAATVTITGFREEDPRRAASAGMVTVRTSADPVGAPIFYRDVPLMPSELEQGVIKPLDASAVPLIAWRLRNIGEPRSRLLMEGLHTCANCHSFSRDGKTLGMDLDGPRNDKGMYALVSLAPRTVIRNEDVVTWSSFKGRLWGDLRVAFMSQVSPDGKQVVTTVEGLGLDAGKARARKTNLGNYYVANFKDYRFLQVFYPTRGILAWYSREKGILQPLPGADDPQYVHADAVWSPDGKYLVFARARATEPYPAGGKMAEFSNDPNETQIQYDLYRIPFNDGKGGRPEPIQGASANGMSNTFPKVSPDGRWIVFVQCRNGQLMRPDSQLYIVPAGGGQARRMSANTPLMNSWHSFSPNGRWLVFSSKSRSPYTQMFLTHLDENGQDSPAILIDNATAANRAVNIPEFVNIPPDGLLKIDTPAVEYYKLFNQAWELGQKGQHQAAVAEWKKALELSPEDFGGNLNLGISLAATGKLDEAILHFQRAAAANPEAAEAYTNLGLVLAEQGKLDQAISQYRRALEIDPEYPEALGNLGLAQAAAGRLDQAIGSYRRALELRPTYTDVHLNLGVALARTGRVEEAIAHFERVVELDPQSAEAYNDLGIAMAGRGKLEEAIARYRKALEISPNYAEAHNNLGLALAGAGRLEEAILHLRSALEINAAYPAAHNNLGMTLARAGRLDEAITHYRKAVEINPRYLEAHSNLAAAYAELGRFPEAVETARRALALANAAGERSLAEALAARIAQYQANTPSGSLR
jgi:tetratricopeptide (TPR) repeat protein